MHMTLTQPEAGSPEFWAETTPDAIAVVAGDETLTYREWNERSDRVAEVLAEKGLRSGDRLGMRFRLCIEWFVVQRALQKLGVAQVAVNWKLTPEEALYIVRDSGAKGLACDDADPSAWTELGTGLLLAVGQETRSDWLRYEDLVGMPTTRTRFGPLRQDMVLYTSGTTGAPRGVPPVDPGEVDDLDRLIRYVLSVGSVPPMTPGIVQLLTLPVHHDAGPGLATAVCAQGGTSVLLDPYEPEAALALIEQHRITTWTTVPTMLLRIQALPAQVLARYDLSSVTAINVGAAPVPHTLKTWLIDHFGPVLWEVYGASEAGMISYVAPEHQLTRPGTSGLPYDGVELAIVDEHWNRLPAGKAGEIAVSTPVVLKNYIGSAALGEDIVKDGFYRTGDSGHLDEDGFLFITDRIKDMIVAGGTNVYPAEIEKVLVEHADMLDAAVIGIPHPDFGEQPMAFIETRAGSLLDENDLRSFLDTRLAKFKHPRRFEFAAELPRNAIGKVLKNELRKPYWQGRDRHV